MLCVLVLSEALELEMTSPLTSEEKSRLGLSVIPLSQQMAEDATLPGCHDANCILPGPRWQWLLRNLKMMGNLMCSGPRTLEQFERRVKSGRVCPCHP